MIVIGPYEGWWWSSPLPSLWESLIHRQTFSIGLSCTSWYLKGKKVENLYPLGSPRGEILICAHSLKHLVLLWKGEKVLRNASFLPLLKPYFSSSYRIIHLNLKNVEMNLSDTSESCGIKPVSHKDYRGFSGDTGLGYYRNFNISWLFKY